MNSNEIDTIKLTHKKNVLYIILCSIFITHAIVAEIIGVKIFSLEKTLGTENIPFLQGNFTAGVIIWPIVFIVSDIINEYFGKDGVRRISIITACLIAYSFFVIFIATKLTPADFWLEVNKTDIEGNSFNINTAYSTIFRQGLGIIIGSITAFLIGQLLDAYIFDKLKNVTGKKFFWLRSTGSTLISQLIDSFIVLWIAFYVFGNWSFQQLIDVATVNYIYKFVVAILLIPLLYVVHNLIDKYLYSGE